MKHASVARVVPAFSILILSLAASLAVTWPLVLKPGAAVMIDTEIPLSDLLMPTWFSWYYSTVLADLVSKPGLLFWTNLFNYPAGYDLWLNVPHQFLSIPEGILTCFLGYPAGINVFQLMVLTLNGFSLGWVVRRLSGRWLIGALLGVMYGISPFFLREVMALRTEQTIGFLLPLVAWRLVVFRRERSTRSIWLLGCVMAATAVTYVFFGLFAFLLLGFSMIYDLFSRPVSPGKVLTDCARVLAVVMLVSLPFSVPYLAVMARGKVVQGLSLENFLIMKRPSIQGSTDSPVDGRSSFSVPSTHAPDGKSNDVNLQPKSSLLDSNRMLAVTLAVFGLSAPFLWRKGARFWGISAGIFLVFALGPRLTFLSFGISIPLPGVVLTVLPVFSRLLVPLRFLVMVYMCIAVGVALVVERRENQPFAARPLRRTVCCLVGCAGLCLLTRWQVPMRLARVPESPPTVKYLASHPGGAVIDLPLPLGETGDHAVWAQVKHGHPVVAVPDSRVTFTSYQGVDARLKDNSVISLLCRIEEVSGDHIVWEPKDMDELLAMGYRYVLVHLSLIGHGREGGGVSDHITGDVLRFGTTSFTPENRLRCRRIKENLKKMCGEPVAEDSRFLLFELHGG